MFGLGMGELLVILVIALIFLGPKKLPEVASSLGKAIRSFRKATNELSEQLDVDESVKAPLRELKAALRDEPAPHVLAVQQPNAQPIKKDEPKPAAASSALPPQSDAPPPGPEALPKKV
jgi:TatA/E family protein of Tat protein translocase